MCSPWSYFFALLSYLRVVCVASSVFSPSSRSFFPSFSSLSLSLFSFCHQVEDKLDEEEEEEEEDV